MLYLLLAAIGASILASWLWRPPGPVPVALFGLTLASVGTANLALYGVLRLYSYSTGLAPPPKDDYLGEFLAEMIFVPALFSLVGRVHGRWRYAGGLAAAGACFRAWIWLTQQVGWYSGTNALWGGVTAGALLYGLGWLDSWFAKQK